MAISQDSDTANDSKRPRLDLREEALNRTIWSLSLPAILSNLMFTAVFFCDTLIVGWLRDENCLAATVLVGPMMWLINAPFHALGDAATSLVSRCWGERDFHGARRCGGQSMCLAFLLTSAFLVICWPPAYHIIRWLGGADLVVAIGGHYLRVVLLSIVLGLPMIVATAVIRGTGDAITPMILTTIMNVVNVGASILLAFGAGPIPAFGLIGVAWGTVIARSLGGALSIAVLIFSPKATGLTLRDLVVFSRGPFARVWRLTYPAMLDRLLSSFAHLAFIRMVAVLGTTVLAAHNIALHVESLAFMPAAGISVAVATIVGQAIGAHRAHIADLTVTRTLWWSSLLMGVLGALFVLFAPQFVVIFGATPEVLRLAGLALQVSALELPFLALYMLLAGSLRGAGDTRSPLFASLAGIFLFRLGATYLFAIVFGWGLAGVWLATALDWAARTLCLWWVFRRGVWKLIHEREKEEERARSD